METRSHRTGQGNRGRPSCVKNKVIVTDDKGDKHESTVWNATDLKNFPVKIETTNAICR